MLKKSVSVAIMACCFLLASCHQRRDGFSPPAGCAVVGAHYASGDVVFQKNPNQPASVFLLYNTSKKSTLVVNHSPGSDPGASAGWASNLKPNHWSALMMTTKEFTLNCRKKINDSHYASVACAQVLQVCRFKVCHAKDKKSLYGNYWLSENKSRMHTLETIKDRDFNCGK